MNVVKVGDGGVFNHLAEETRSGSQEALLPS